MTWPTGPGVAVLHAGKHRHGARPISGGERINLILWCRSRHHRVVRAGYEAKGSCPGWCADAMG